jgi:hypothetical protein
VTQLRLDEVSAAQAGLLTDMDAIADVLYARTAGKSGGH